MGHRANLVLVEDGNYRLFYCHWCAITIPSDIFWGPHYAIPFVQTQQKMEADESGWLDEIWSEGGVLVDSDRRHVLVYGGDGLHYDIPLRRLYMELLRLAWPGWTAKWAFDGITEIAEYVGYDIPESDLLGEDDSIQLDPPEEKHEVDTIGSFIFEDDSLRLFALPQFGPSELLKAGPPLIEAAKDRPGFESLKLAEWLKPGAFPVGGFHVDVPSKQIVYWSASSHDKLRRMQAAWPGWDVRWLEDRYEEHLALTRGKLIFPSYAVDDLLPKLERQLLGDSSHAIKFFQALIGRMSEEGKDMQVNPSALGDQPQEITVAVRKQLFDDLVERWKSGQSGN